MNTLKTLAIVLIVAGMLALTYGGFTYTRQTSEAKLGPIELTVNEKRAVDIPIWAGVSTIVVGCALLLWGGRQR